MREKLRMSHCPLIVVRVNSEGKWGIKYPTTRVTCSSLSCRIRLVSIHRTENESLSVRLFRWFRHEHAIPVFSPSRLHLDRALGGDRHHRHPDWHVAAGCAASAFPRGQDPVRQQHAPDRY